MQKLGFTISLIEFEKGKRIVSISDAFSPMRIRNVDIQEITDQAKRFNDAQEFYGETNFWTTIRNHPELRSDGLTNWLLSKFSADYLIDIKYDIFMMDILELNQYKIEFNSQRYPGDKSHKELFQSCGEGMLNRVIKTIKDPMGRVIYMGKNVIYRIDDCVFCQGQWISHLRVVGNVLCVAYQESFREVLVDDEKVRFKQHVGKVKAKDVRLTTEKGLYVQKKTSRNSSSSTSS